MYNIKNINTNKTHFSFFVNIDDFVLQCNAAVGMKAFFDMMHEGPHKVMLFGAACTQVTDPIAKASKHWRITQVNNTVYTIFNQLRK